MWFDGIRQPNTVYVASVSRGKDSTAMLRAIQIMGWPLDDIVSADIWFDAETPAELPPMVAFKNTWDKKCLELFGVPVTRVCAKNKDGTRKTYCDVFYKKISRDRERERERERERVAQRQEHSRKLPNLRIPTYARGMVSVRSQTLCLMGYPSIRCRWCTGELKRAAARQFSDKPSGTKGEKINIVHYIGIAADEPKRIRKHMPKKDYVLPLVQIGWDEGLCGLEAQYMDMLSPTYTGAMRDGCWFCHNQGINQLRSLYHDYPELWQKLMAIDLDSPVTFHADGRTVHDFDRRFRAEDEGIIDINKRFRWKDLDEHQVTMGELIGGSK